MERITEPELMLDDDLARAYARVAFEDAHSTFTTAFQEIFPDQDISGYILDLGCGPGDITLRFARAFPKCIVHGLDGSATMLRYGREILAQAHDIQDRVEFIQGVVPGAVLPRPTYDVVVSNSLLHHIHDPQVLWQAVRHYAAPGAPVFVMDLVRPDSFDAAQALTDTYVPNEPEIMQLSYYNSLLAAFEIPEIEEQLRAAKLDTFSVKMVTNRHVAVFGRMIS